MSQLTYLVSLPNTTTGTDRDPTIYQFDLYCIISSRPLSGIQYQKTFLLCQRHDLGLSRYKPSYLSTLFSPLNPPPLIYLYLYFFSAYPFCY